MKLKWRNQPEEIFAGHCGGFGVALRDGCNGGMGLATSGQKPTPPFLEPWGTGTNAEGDGLTGPWVRKKRYNPLNHQCDYQTIPRTSYLPVARYGNSSVFGSGCCTVLDHPGRQDPVQNCFVSWPGFRCWSSSYVAKLDFVSVIENGVCSEIKVTHILTSSFSSIKVASDVIVKRSFLYEQLSYFLCLACRQNK